MKNLSIFLLLFLVLNACNFPEHYFEPAPACKVTSSLTDNQPLILQEINDKQPADYRYFFKTFREENNATYMVTNFRNEATCFDVNILIDQWYQGHKLSGMRRTNGKSYPKELYDLKWMVNENQEVVYVDMHDIID